MIEVMGKKEALKIFENKNVRVIWDDEQEEWYFSVVDVVEVLTDSVNPTDYLKKMRKREPELNTYLGTNCPLILMTTQTGKRRKTLAAIQGQQYASLTDIITTAWSGRTTKQYKHLKGLHKENLRDNMTNVELLLNSLAEASATENCDK